MGEKHVYTSVFAVPTFENSVPVIHPEKNKDFFNPDSHFLYHINIVGCSKPSNERLFAISVTIGTRVQYFYEL